MRNAYYFTPKVKVYDGERASDNFDVHDNNYLDGTTIKRPPDFDLHLALYILEKENLPDNLLMPLQEWVRDNKMVLR